MLKVALIEGDGIGPEVARAAESLLERCLEVELVKVRAGKSYFVESGSPIEEGWLEKVRGCDALLKGPVATPTKGPSYPSINSLLRKSLRLFANVRPFRSYEGISLRRMNTVIVRENLECLYYGWEVDDEDRAIAMRVITRRGAERICEFAFRLAEREERRRVTAIHKKNILKRTDGLFLSTFYEVASKFNLKADDEIVDAAGYKLVKMDNAFDVMVTPNLYGDILSDVAAGVIGSIGLCGSAQIGEDFAAFEPIHGTAEDIAGRGIANPIGTLIAVSMMLDWLAERGKVREGMGDKIRGAIDSLLRDGTCLTPDLGGSCGTEEVAEEIMRRF
ncbi:MAG: isocitrate/isopropylmalate family dehydrogenase [Candidatus Korarchaeum sp.]|nr:isocitrate/isopropylmalate family dehydrogenase [Candidatus Korarchaeum sp.]MDW8035753.1 isocitrate/isopropylmalate family dehydrogenase [Candidatus Korarchaeum sp.]